MLSRINFSINSANIQTQEFLVNISVCIVVVRHLGDKLYARWWQLFRDIVSPRRHDNNMG
jgi:hypothetical protein